MPLERINFLGIPLDTGIRADDVCTLLRARDALRLVTFVNPLAWSIARKNPRYVDMLRSMSLVLPDGEGVARACRLLTKRDCPRVSFDTTSVALPFFAAAVKEQATIMLIGSQPGTDEEAHIKLDKNFPGLQIVGTQHGYGNYAPKVAAVMATNPDVVIVGMGSPRQEEFLLALRDAGYRGFAITCGGFLDQYVESDHYYPALIDRWNLRFAWRLCKEPRRLWRRYLIDYQFFIWLVLKTLVVSSTPVPVKQWIAARLKRV
jgi:N-acetylglucosaminyldiphosphoundecaprenol N-acetyl-beta-D-mannosaminyltransferase